MESSKFAAMWVALTLGTVAGCGSSGSSEFPNATGTAGAGGSGPTMMTGGGSIIVATGGGAGTDPTGGTGGTGGGFLTDGGLPPGFTPSDKGGYKLGDPVPSGTGALDGGPGNGSTGCGATLTGIVRDLSDTHPDFEDYCCGDTRGAVASILGAGRKPVYALSGPAYGTNNGPQLMTGATEFDQWYRTVDGVSMPYFIYFYFVLNNGVFTFHSSSFFPLDGTGFTNQGRNHNFHFATELHTQFKYRGGETFRFTGDDDLWVFINEHLAIDLGGVHGAENAEVNLDMRAQEFGIEPGKVYALDLFHAERHTSESNFRVDTNLEFVNCGIIVR